MPAFRDGRNARSPMRQAVPTRGKVAESIAGKELVHFSRPPPAHSYNARASDGCIVGHPRRGDKVSRGLRGTCTQHPGSGRGPVIMTRMERHGVVIDEQRLADFCRRHGIRSLRLFGSILRSDFRPDSDVDVLVEFAPGKAPGWIGFANLALELEGMIGREVDLRTADDFSENIRRRVLREAEVQYAA